MANKLDRRCPTCDVQIGDKNKTGFCNSHRNRSGANNPMAGKSVYDRWVEKHGVEEADRRKAASAAKMSQTFQKKWKEPEYRQKVFYGTIGKTRTLEFRSGQSDRARKQMKDPAQRDLRSKTMTRSYETGALTADHVNNNCYGTRGFHEGHFYASKCELERIKTLMDSEIKWKRYAVDDLPFKFYYEYKGKTHLYIPDFLIKSPDGSIIIEEVKYDRNRISDREWAKCDAGLSICTENGITYRIIDDPFHPVTP